MERKDTGDTIETPEKPPWYMDVTDLKQYTCCPRIVFYRYCLPRVRPTTFLMAEGTRGHHEEEEREDRRSLKHYGVSEGERWFHVALQSETLGMIGRLDLLIVTPGRARAGAEAIVVDYKHSEQRAGAHFKLQLAAYALLVEECWHLPVTRGFLYSIPLRRAEEVRITPALRHKVTRTVAAIRALVERDSMPDAPTARGRCVTCEFRRFCNDVV